MDFTCYDIISKSFYCQKPLSRSQRSYKLIPSFCNESKITYCVISSELISYRTFSNFLVRTIPHSCRTFWLRLHYRYWELLLLFFYFWFEFYGPFKNISLISSWSFIKGGRKMENPGKNHPTIHKQNLAFPNVTQSEARTTAVRNLMD